MRTRWFLIGLCGLASTATIMAAGCNLLVAEYYDPLTNPNLATGGSGADGGEGGPPPECSGDPSEKNVIEGCGVFVSAAAAPGGTGTRASPYSSLQKAIDDAGGKRVYACAAMPFSEAVTIAAPVEVFGGFADCAASGGWTWTQEGRSELDGPADQIALTIEKGAAGASVEGFKIVGASPSSMTMGGSSIAVVVDDVAATLEQCDVSANDAADGIDGTTPSGTAQAGAPAPSMMVMGAPTDACVLPTGVMGGTGGVTMCADGMTTGGNGGSGGLPGAPDGPGQKGTAGAPVMTSPPPGNDGLAGAGQSTSGGICQQGDPGAPGDSGSAGSGGSVSGDMLSLTGVTNSDDTDGKPGTRGQGGGGGGGAMAGTFCMVNASTVDGPGASGGGGGAGGCGGLGGGGGKAGGSSLAIVSLGTKLTLSSVTLAVGKGGRGGTGALGQAGGAFGNGANGGASSGLAGSKAGCPGGNGGAGGDGGPGGGGRGGHAIGIAYATTPSAVPMIKTYTAGAPGDGGSAGSGAPVTSSGANGNQGQCWDFSKSKACGM
jgi:hypothetical protein